MVAYGTKRTLVLKSRGWRYHKGGWEEVFKPVSDTCNDPSGESVSSWPGKKKVGETKIFLWSPFKKQKLRKVLFRTIKITFAFLVERFL